MFTVNKVSLHVFIKQWYNLRSSLLAYYSTTMQAHWWKKFNHLLILFYSNEQVAHKHNLHKTICNLSEKPFRVWWQSCCSIVSIYDSILIVEQHYVIYYCLCSLLGGFYETFWIFNLWVNHAVLYQVREVTKNLYWGLFKFRSKIVSTWNKIICS